jgi:hypothetical protein
MTDLWTELERQFQEQIAGTTPPKEPEPYIRAGTYDQLPRPWTAREGAEL